jgi:hypothetical protein
MIPDFVAATPQPHEQGRLAALSSRVASVERRTLGTNCLRVDLTLAEGKREFSPCWWNPVGISPAQSMAEKKSYGEPAGE